MTELWLLVLIVLHGQDPVVTAVNEPMTMIECFEAREVLSIQIGKDYPNLDIGHFPPGMQAVCIKVQSN